MRHHHEALLQAIKDGGSIVLLATSHEKVIKDITFWRSLLAARGRVKIEFIFLDPTSVAAVTRERQSYLQKGGGFLREEIRENMAMIARMARTLGANRPKSKLAIRMSTSDVLPDYRITLLSQKRVLVAPYHQGQRTGISTNFADVASQLEPKMFSQFEGELAEIQKKAREVTLAR